MLFDSSIAVAKRQVNAVNELAKRGSSGAILKYFNEAPEKLKTLEEPEEPEKAEKQINESDKMKKLLRRRLQGEILQGASLPSLLPGLSHAAETPGVSSWDELLARPDLQQDPEYGSYLLGFSLQPRGPSDQDSKALHLGHDSTLPKNPSSPPDSNATPLPLPQNEAYGGIDADMSKLSLKDEQVSPAFNAMGAFYKEKWKNPDLVEIILKPIREDLPKFKEALSNVPLSVLPIIGFPGSSKTNMLATILNMCLQDPEHDRIMARAPTHAAVGNLVERMVQLNTEAVDCYNKFSRGSPCSYAIIVHATNPDVNATAFINMVRSGSDDTSIWEPLKSDTTRRWFHENSLC